MKIELDGVTWTVDVAAARLTGGGFIERGAPIPTSHLLREVTFRSPSGDVIRSGLDSPVLREPTEAELLDLLKRVRTKRATA